MYICNDVNNIIYSYYWKTMYYKLVICRINKFKNLAVNINDNLSYLILKNKSSYKEQYDYLIKFNNFIKKINYLKGEKLLLMIIDKRFNLIFKNDNLIFNNEYLNYAINYISITSGYMRYYVLQIYNNIVNFLNENKLS